VWVAASYERPDDALSDDYSRLRGSLDVPGEKRPRVCVHGGEHLAPCLPLFRGARKGIGGSVEWSCDVRFPLDLAVTSTAILGTWRT
jgi:hypothetical protein